MTHDEMPIHLPARIADRELAAHLRDADLDEPGVLHRLMHVAALLGRDLDIDLALLEPLPRADQRAGLDSLAASLQT